MTKNEVSSVAFAAMLVVALVSQGCGGNGDTATSGASDTSTSASSGGGGGVGGGGGGGGGAGGGVSVDKGAPATETVSGGDVSHSANYKMVHTFGQPTQNQGKSTSSTYRLQGGLQGANGSLP